jgi:ribonuclease E
MTKSMLIDASHPEETRVVVVSDKQLEEFEFESSTKKQLKGNIYLAKVTRVEPSLQAAFVDYGGQRHGFLAFSEIHPDYYQIPQADRKLLDEASRLESEAAAEPDGAAEETHRADADSAEAVSTDPDEETAEVFDEQARRRSRLLRSYKIQEVIKRRQILLVQVVKEERGSKGAALTTYLSLAGRYCVLMPNTGRGGGISRKISSPADRSRLKAIARELDVPHGMGLIVRTAGEQRSKLEIRRDYEYLLRLWNDIRERTLNSVAPCTIHEEGALIKRAIRDLYARDVDEVLVEGEEGYRDVRKVMAMLMPSRARRVKLFKDEQLPLFHHYAVEEQLDQLHSPIVRLRSGGSIVIHTTEALTAIDVNSGRSTRERNIEETALKTNLEAADEVARQLRLRDLAGLVVVDFIDMDENRNQRAVERRFREALKSDRARVQIGRISPFGLLELSRQRLRPSFQELSTEPCPSCHGSGFLRSVESAALQALRVIEIEGIKGATAALAIALPEEVALYVLNQKRDRLVGLEQRYAMSVEIRAERDLAAGDYELEAIEARRQPEPSEAAAAEARPAAAESAAESTEEDAEAAGRKRKRRRRRRRKPSDGEAETIPLAAAANGDARGGAPEEEADYAAAGAADAVPEPDAGSRPVEPEPAAAEAAGEVEPQRAEPAEEPQPKPRRRARRPTRRAARIEDAITAPESAGPRENGADRQLEPAPPEVVVPEQSRVAEAAGEEAEPEPGRPGQGGPERPSEAERQLVHAAAAEEEQGGPPRRGWWSRFVRKDD